MSSPYVPYTPTGSFPDLDGTGGLGPLALIQNGQIVNHDNLILSNDATQGYIAKLIDACDWLYKHLSAAVLSAAHTWSGAQTFTGGLVIQSQVVEQPARALPDATATTATVDAPTSRVWYVQSPTATTLAVTLKSTSPAPADGSELEFAAFGIQASKSVDIKREGASLALVTMPGAGFGSARVKFIGGVWRLLSCAGVATEVLP
jgi:hypothetical protein